MSALRASRRDLKVGGPVDPQEDLYISRGADQEFLDLLRAGEYVNIITSRQMGKTSMVYRAIAQLAPHGVRFAYFDLSRLRNEPQARRYFRSLLDEIARELCLDVDLHGFWEQGERKANGQLIVDLFRLALDALEGPVVVVLDEIDSTLESAQLDYTDDLFTAIRSLYTIRPREPLFKRLSFCLVGGGTPNKLIKARRTTPYNIGRTLWLSDFDARWDDLAPLAGILSDDPASAQPLLARVLYWTGGQPYLTMWMCDELRHRRALDPAAADELVEQTFTSLERLRGQVHVDSTHFDQTQRFLNERAVGGAEELGLYERILRGAREADQPANPTYSHLKLAGLVKRDENGELVVRNPIYARLFDLAWVRQTRPRRELRRARRISSVALGLLIVAMSSAGYYYLEKVVPLKRQEQARQGLEKLNVKLARDTRGFTVIELPKQGTEGVLRQAVPYLEVLGTERESQNQAIEISSAARTDWGALAQLTALRRLVIGDSSFSSLGPVAALTRLQELDISSTLVTDLAPLANLKQLKVLELSNTAVSDLKPLAGLVNLRQLDLANTPVDDISPLANLARLEELNLSHTRVKDLAPLRMLMSLRHVALDGLGVRNFTIERHDRPISILQDPPTDGAASEFRTGKSFRECPACPQMVAVPTGTFLMGSPMREPGRIETESPQHEVAVARFAVAKFETRFDEWDRCVRAGGCAAVPDAGFGRGARPVVYVSFDDALAYARWLSGQSGRTYRLLTEAEWEYAARAGSTTAYPWGEEPGSNRANFSGSGSQWSDQETAPVGSFEPNAFGLHDMIGNVWEWTEDCFYDNYLDAPDDGSARMADGCKVRVLRGGSWNYGPLSARSANRDRDSSANRFNGRGFRVARDLSQ